MAAPEYTWWKPGQVVTFQHPEWKVKEAVRLRREEGKTNREISLILTIPVDTIYAWMGATPRRLGGQPHHPVGLQDRARYLREAGYTVSEISEEMGVARSTVGDWVQGMPCDSR